MKALLTIILASATWAVSAQQVSDFQLPNVLNNQTVSLGTFPACEGLVIIFTTNACPYDEYYRERIARLAASYADKVPVLLVNSSPEAADTKEKMIEKAKKLNLSLPYLADKDQKLMASMDARKSPEAFLLKNTDGKFSVVYRGAIDDNAQVEADVRQNYLRDAIDIMLAKQKIETREIRATGCNLKKKT